MHPSPSQSPHPCALRIASITINDRNPLPDHPVRSVFLAAFQAAAAEFFEGRASQIGLSCKGRTLILEIEPHAHHPDNIWSLWLDDCDMAALKPQIYWLRDDEGNRGHAHEKISEHIYSAVKKLRPDPLFQSKETVIVIRADISVVSAHDKMLMIAARKDLLARTPV